MARKRSALTYIEWATWSLLALCLAARFLEPSDSSSRLGETALALLGVAFLLAGARGVREARHRARSKGEGTSWAVMASLPSALMAFFGFVVVIGFLYLNYGMPPAPTGGEGSATGATGAPTAAREDVTRAPPVTPEAESAQEASNGVDPGGYLFLVGLAWVLGMFGLQRFRFGSWTGMEFGSRVETELGTTPWRDGDEHRVRFRLVRLASGRLGLVSSHEKRFQPDSTLTTLSAEQAADLVALLQQGGHDARTE